MSFIVSHLFVQRSNFRFPKGSGKLDDSSTSPIYLVSSMRIETVLLKLRGMFLPLPLIIYFCVMEIKQILTYFSKKCNLDTHGRLSD